MLRRAHPLLRTLSRHFRHPMNYFDVKPLGELKGNQVRPTPVASDFDRSMLMAEVEARLVKALKLFQKLDMDSFAFEKKFRDLDLDSLETIHALTIVENEFDTVFPENVFDNFESFREVANYLHVCKFRL